MDGNGCSEGAVGGAQVTRGWRRDKRTVYRRSGGLSILVAVAAIGLTACSGGPTNPPHIASLGKTSSNSRSGSTTTAPHSGNATQLMDEWAACMRNNGDPDQTDPTIDSHGVINITMPDSVSPTLSSEVHGSTGPCSQYELAAENALRAGQQYNGPSQTQGVQYTNCMRANGVPNYPDPGSNGRTNFNGTGVDPNSPFVEKANKLCGKKLGLPNWWINGWGPPGDVTVTSAGLNPNGAPPCASAKSGCVQNGGGGNGEPARVPSANSGSSANG